MMTKLNKEDLVVATKEEEFWINVKKDTDTQIETLNKQLKFLTAVQSMSETNIQNEQKDSDTNSD